jgi:hypothetical protein
MCCGDMLFIGRPCFKAGLVVLLLAMSVLGVGCGGGHRAAPVLPGPGGPAVAGNLLALWFAPELYLNPSEPFELVAVVPVFHPSKPMIAYHVFFDEDAMLAGRGKDLDHEVLWIEYDPVTLKVVEVFTLWHRAVLTTNACAPDARLRGQHARVCVQWGQHGLLPFGWQDLVSARPKLELRMHYKIVTYVNRIPLASPLKPPVAFKGSYDAYLTFTEVVDTSEYIRKQSPLVAEDADQALRPRIARSFYSKKAWPDW